MTVVKRIARTSRLSTLIDKAGGVSVGVALAQADRNLAALRPRSMEMATAAITSLGALPPPTCPQSAQSAADSAYASASVVIDATGPFGMNDVCTAASGLCDVLDAVGADIDWRIVTVHAQSMRMLMTLPENDRQSRDAILGELRRVVDHAVPS